MKSNFGFKGFVATAMILAVVSANSVVFADSFADIGPSDWYFGYVQNLVAAGVLDGTKPTFDASLHVTRDMAAKIVVKAAGYSDRDLVNADVPSFIDVPKSSWAYAYIETAKSLGFISGYPGRIYAPGNEVSRAEFATMLMKAFKLQKTLTKTVGFADVRAEDWFYDPIETVYGWSIVDGYENGVFKPYNPINRAEMSKMIVQAMSPVLRKNSSKVADTPKVDTPTKDTGLIIDNKVVDKPKVTNDGSGSSGTSGIPRNSDTSGGTVNTGGTGTGTPSMFTEDFSTFNPQYFADSTSFGPWLDQFGGYGLVGIEANATNKWLRLSPSVSDASGKTSSSLVTGPSYTGSVTLEAKLLTVAQLRTGSTPNPWEVAWIVWNYTDNDHFYYFIPKTNGWELGKRDPKYPGGQRFLATGDTPAFPIGKTYDVKIEQDASNTITVWVDGVQITTFTDTETPYTSGNIGFYTEDAQINVDDVSAK